MNEKELELENQDLAAVPLEEILAGFDLNLDGGEFENTGSMPVLTNAIAEEVAEEAPAEEISEAVPAEEVHEEEPVEETSEEASEEEKPQESAVTDEKIGRAHV